MSRDTLAIHCLYVYLYIMRSTSIHAPDLEISLEIINEMIRIIVLKLLLSIYNLLTNTNAMLMKNCLKSISVIFNVYTF